MKFKNVKSDDLYKHYPFKTWRDDLRLAEQNHLFLQFLKFHFIVSLFVI